MRQRNRPCQATQRLCWKSPRLPAQVLNQSPCETPFGRPQTPLANPETLITSRNGRRRRRPSWVRCPRPSKIRLVCRFVVFYWLVCLSLTPHAISCVCLSLTVSSLSTPPPPPLSLSLSDMPEAHQDSVNLLMKSQISSPHRTPHSTLYTLHTTHDGGEWKLYHSASLSLRRA